MKTAEHTHQRVHVISDRKWMTLTPSSKLFGTTRSIQNAKVQRTHVETLYFGTECTFTSLLYVVIISSVT
jgi:hypothetical protein